VHLAAIGHPLLGDALYAPPEVCGAAPRLLLHAERLMLLHPASGAELDLLVPAPF
jgi:tRNA pseudouridine32 synthase/23S rRNA pseudouridine746 synthase